MATSTIRAAAPDASLDESSCHPHVILARFLFLRLPHRGPSRRDRLIQDTRWVCSEN